MIDPTYAAQVLAWAAVWSAAGLSAREALAKREADERRTGGGQPAKRVPAGKAVR